MDHVAGKAEAAGTAIGRWRAGRRRPRFIARLANHGQPRGQIQEGGAGDATAVKCLAACLPADLSEFRRVDAIEIETLTCNLEAIAIDHDRCAADLSKRLSDQGAGCQKTEEKTGLT